MQEQAPKSEMSAVRLNHETGRCQNAKMPFGNGQKEINQLVSSLPTILIGLSKDYRIVLWNTKAEEVFGKNQAEVIGLTLQQCGVDWEWNKIADGISESRTAGRPNRMDNIRFKGLDGEERYLGLTINHLDGDHDCILGSTMIGADITNRKKLDIQLQIRATDYNRFQDKMLKGTAQIFQWGWNADYPDPENFMFLLYGRNSKVEHNGENACNYKSEEFDRLFERMKNMDNSPERQEVIDGMVEVLRRDAPWVFGFHPKQFVLYHGWYHNSKANLMANNTLKNRRINPALREQRRASLQ